MTSGRNGVRLQPGMLVGQIPGVYGTGRRSAGLGVLERYQEGNTEISKNRSTGWLSSDRDTPGGGKTRKGSEKGAGSGKEHDEERGSLFSSL